MKKNNEPTRPEQLSDQYTRLIDQHLEDLVTHRADEMYEIENFADIMCIHPNHLSNTIKDFTGISACGIYQEKIIETARKMLDDPTRSIRSVAITLTFEPSQFTKWFKRFQGMTPGQYRKGLKTEQD
jgi:AraC family transcriptional regulator of adaptative response / methylphosphotriester-DNA alkyltransferase methyltransferase